MEEPLVIGAVADQDMIANRTGDMMRRCGARTFETTFLYEDHSPTADLPIISENGAAFECVLNESAARGYRLNIELREDRKAQR